MGSIIGCFSLYASREAKNTLEILFSSSGMPKWTRHKFYRNICDNSKSIYKLTWKRKDEFINIYIISDGRVRLRIQYRFYKNFIGCIYTSPESVNNTIERLRHLNSQIR